MTTDDLKTEAETIARRLDALDTGADEKLAVSTYLFVLCAKRLKRLPFAQAVGLVVDAWGLFE